MLILDKIKPEAWYKVTGEFGVAEILGLSEDAIYDRIRWGVIQARIDSVPSSRTRRAYNTYRIQGCEIIRYVKEHMTLLSPARFRRIA